VKADLGQRSDNMVIEYNKVMNKINRANQFLNTADGQKIDIGSFLGPHFASYNRIQMAAHSFLEGLKEHLSWSNTLTSFKDLLDSKIPGKILFNFEVYFMMNCSAFEMLPWELNFLFPTPLTPDHIDFTGVVNFLTDRKRMAINPFIPQLKTQNDGWIRELRNYRDYIIHRGHLQLQTRIGGQTIPDLIPDNPKDSHLVYSTRSLSTYCNDTFVKSLDLFREFYGFVDSQLI